MNSPVLDVRNLHVDYDGFQVLRGISMTLSFSDVVVVLGPNGAGKSTLLNSISGLVRNRQGTITLLDQRVERMPAHRRVALGLAHVLERRRLFPFHTVLENLMLGSYLPKAKALRNESLADALDLFPALKSKLTDQAGKLSGGQQQQVAIARGLMSRPAVLMLDEPFLGLSPAVVDDISHAIRGMKQRSITTLFIEHNVDRALMLADRGYVLESGAVAIAGTRAELLVHERVREVYLGERRDPSLRAR